MNFLFFFFVECIGELIGWKWDFIIKFAGNYRCNNLSSVEAGFGQNFCWEMGFSPPNPFRTLNTNHIVTFGVFLSVTQAYPEKENPSSRNMSGTSDLCTRTR